MKLNSKTYYDKVLGCWTGKNIGGTLGGPLECLSPSFSGKPSQDIMDVSFYVQDFNGVPLPNDDLDLQLVWLRAAEEFGLPALTPETLGSMWLACISGPWNEYGVGKANMKAGLPPPLSGACWNDRWKWSNGAWIRSEIWACLFPGDPDRACEYAWMDACVDHCGEGIYAEIFTAAVESYRGGKGLSRRKRVE